MDATGRLALEKIQADALGPVSDLRNAINGHADKLDTAGIFTHGNGAPAAAAGVVDRWYTDDLSGDVYRDDGDSWNLMVPGAVIARLPSAGEKSALAGSSGAPAGGNRFVTELDPRISGLVGSSNVVFVAAVGDGAASEFAINHNLGTRSIEVQVRQSNAPFAVVEPDIELTTTNQVTVRFTPTVPVAGEYTVTIMAPGTAIQTVFPAGIMMPWAGDASPTGWLLCNGASYLRADYAALFAALGGAGSPYGLPDGTHFNVPDLRDRVPVGASGTIARGAAGGAKTHTLTGAELPGHTHPVNDPGHTHVYNRARNNGTVFGNSTGVTGFYNQEYDTETVSQTTGIVVASNVGGGGAHNNMQPYVGLHYVVKT